jgi:hypothetical protein
MKAMKTHRNRHLDEDQLILAVIDKTDLPAEMQRHLEICPECQKETARLETDLETIGDLAAASTPKLSRSVVFTVEKRSFFDRVYPYRAWVAVAASILLLIAISWSGWLGTLSGTKMKASVTETWEDQVLMMEISSLTENALPEIFLDMSEDAVTGFDEEFIQFVIPDEENDSLSFGTNKKGVLS